MSDERVWLRVVRGEPSPAETAALVAVLLARAEGRAEDLPAPAPSGWTDRRRAVRRPLPHGPGAWRASALPHR